MSCVSVPPLWCVDQLPPPSLRNARSHNEDVVPRRPTALVIDDERIIADTVAQILDVSGFDALPFYSGTAALEQARGRCPDFVISDVVMPGLNGIETAKRLLHFCPATKILLLSGQAATQEMIDQARAEGFSFELLAKPLHPDELLEVLRRLGF